jgi:Txe/YoeB family toxin of Txe-Axe toxin-antitoxin module
MSPFKKIVVIQLIQERPASQSSIPERLKGTDRYEIRISDGYRLTFRSSDQVLELRRIGTHDLLRQEG